MPSNQIIRDHKTFRVLLQTMSRPGTVQQLLPENNQKQAVLGLLSCLIDNEVSINGIGNGAQELVALLTRRHGTRQTEVSDADFIIVSDGSSNGQLQAARRGDLEYPDTGATVLYLVDSLSECGGSITLSGPGINGTASPQISGLDNPELLLLRELNIAFPLGIDAIFVDQKGQCACIPRSTSIKVN